MRTHNKGKLLQIRKSKNIQNTTPVEETVETPSNEDKDELTGTGVGELAERLKSINLKSRKKNVRRKYIF